MVFNVGFTVNAMAGMFGFLLFLYMLLQILKKLTSKNKLPPQPSGAWPVLGHLPLLGGQPQVTLGNMADKYGPIFMIRNGFQRTLIVSSSELAKECLATNDKVFANRPYILAGELMGNGMIIFSPYGPYWRQMRKIATNELLSHQRLQTFRHVRESEVQAAVRSIYQLWEKNKTSSGNALVDMKQWCADITLNVIFRVIFRKRHADYNSMHAGGETDQLRKALMKFAELTEKSVLLDMLPFLRWLDFWGYEKAMKKTAKQLDGIVQGWLDEHKKKRIAGLVKPGEEDFMDILLSILNNAEELLSLDADAVNKATCLGFIFAGSETSKVTLTWVLSLLLSNPEVLKTAQLELDTHIGKERCVQESDMKNLVYLQAIIKETLRLMPPAPLSAPHESMEDCTVGGYHIPKGTLLLVNLWKIHRDPQVWSDPCEFKPKRFLTIQKDLDVRGQNFELLPFGGGRRMCPGASFALQVLQLTLASLLHGFDISTSLHNKPIDLDEGFGVTNYQTSQLQVLLSPRLPPHLYG